MRTPNYRQARKQKEQTRKLRQEEKQQRRVARATRSGDASAGAGVEQDPQQPAAPSPARDQA